MPVNDVVTVDKEFTDFVKNRLKGLPLSQGDEISVMILGNSMDFKINKVSPKGVVLEFGHPLFMLVFVYLTVIVWDLMLTPSSGGGP